MKRYALLFHSGHGEDHWDLFFEEGRHLFSLKLAVEAPSQGDAELEAKAQADHRLHYLNYEGPVSGDRGSVRRVDAGHFVGELARTGSCSLEMRGGRWEGRCELRWLGLDRCRLRFVHRAP